MNLKYRVQNNVYIVEKYKEVKNQNFKKKSLPCVVAKRTAKRALCRVPERNARQIFIFVVRFQATHVKD
jgi:hypothetical protein